MLSFISSIYVFWLFVQLSGAGHTAHKLAKLNQTVTILDANRDKAETQIKNKKTL